MFESILGNEPAKAYLRRAMEQGVLAQTLLFSGMEGIGKALFAREVAAELLGSKKENHPDYHLVKPEGKSGVFAIETIREMIDESHRAPFEAGRKVFVLEDVERMQAASANALLKTLEEPVEDTTFILLTQAPQELLPTIVSRCIHLTFQPLTEEMISTLLKRAGHPVHWAKMGQGSAGRAFELATNPKIGEQQQILFALLAGQRRDHEKYGDLEKLEELVEDEDPVRMSRGVDHLLALAYMWGRDQCLRELGAGPEKLFFPDAPARGGLSLGAWEKRIEKARLAVQRNMKLSACLDSIL